MKIRKYKPSGSKVTQNQLQLKTLELLLLFRPLYLLFQGIFRFTFGLNYKGSDICGSGLNRESAALSHLPQLPFSGTHQPNWKFQASCISQILKLYFSDSQIVKDVSFYSELFVSLMLLHLPQPSTIYHNPFSLRLTLTNNQIGNFKHSLYLSILLLN